MCYRTKIYLYILLFIPIMGFSQSLAESSYEIEKKLPMDTWSVLSDNNLSIHNLSALHGFFEDLHKLYSTDSGKVRITQIGDSHTQVGIFQGIARKKLQYIFGNAGLGFTFPHRLARSNGISELRYTSSIPWESKRNIHATEKDLVGLSGFSLQTTESDFAIKLELNEDAYAFNKLRVFAPGPMFSIAQANREIELKNYSIERKVHTIKSGEALSIIARNYGVTVASIKKANNLRSDVIRAGAKLIIPVKTTKPEPIDRSAFEFLSFLDEENSSVYTFPEYKNAIWLLPSEGVDSFALNGVVLERDNSGLIYDGIGVNGARLIDYNKTTLFFDQLAELESNLIVISLGTNEAFDTIEKEAYLASLEEFIGNVRERMSEVPILITTPPPSLVKRRTPNALVEQYANEIVRIAEDYNVAVWDLYRVLGGNEKIKENYANGLVARDYIHYTKNGYELSGALFSEALLEAFYHYAINLSN